MVRSAFSGSQVVRCLACNLSYLFPKPTSVDGVYEEEYFRAYEAKGVPFPTEGLLRPRYTRRLSELKSLTGGGTLLEIGVGHGAFLQSAQQQGWEVIGVEISRYAAEYVRRTYGINVHCGALSEAGLSADSVDVVHMSHVLEHLREPLAMLQSVKRLLRVGGVLAIEVPNELDTLVVKLRDAVGSPRPYAVRSTHLLFFSPRTLISTVAAAGYAVRKCRTLRNLSDRSFLRRGAKSAAALVERPLGMAPLIELFAQKETLR